ncbi:hypothetical protein ACFU44_19645 [Nocardia rhizosphaerihabitans]|uniref:hypothetical protein n=1 Tax=Nocardia rhizosphaerihabitans TaxID=1691570 RepID=UPI0036722236
MRFIKTSAFAVAFAAVSVFGAGMAQAAPAAPAPAAPAAPAPAAPAAPAPAAPAADTASVEVTEDLIGCALAADASGETLAELHEGFGETIELTAVAEAELTAGDCL